MMKTIMILGASILQLPAIKKAKEMGLDVVVVDMNPIAVGFNVDGVKKEIISTIDTSAVLKAAKKHNIDGIMTLASDMPMVTVAAVSRELGLVGVSEETARRATNKAFMRDALKEGGVPIPLYFRVKGKGQYLDSINAIRKAGYKCIVKPADNSGSRGVILLSEDVDLDEAYKYSTLYSRSGELVVEEFMEGPEVSVETLAVDGKVFVIQITDKLTTGAPYFVEMGHSQPSQLSYACREEICAVAIAANKAIGIKNGPSHTEIKVTRDGPKIVEIGARLGGDCITTHLVPLSTGVNMVECSIKIALGEKPDLQAKCNKGSAIRYIDSKPGTIKAISGLAEAKSVPGVVEVSIVYDVNEKIGDIHNSIDRVGFVIAKDETVLKAINAAVAGVSKIDICVDGDLL